MQLKQILDDPQLNEISKIVMIFAQKLSGKIYYPYQQIIGENIVKHVIAQTMEDLTVLLSRQSGKLFCIETPLLTPEKWTLLKDLKIGDYIYSPSGLPVKVLWKSDIQDIQKCYRVTTTDGKELLVGEEHLWTVFDTRLRKEITLSTQEILDRGLSRYKTETRKVITNGKEYQTREYRFRLPEQKVLQLPNKELLIDPYLLGAWLGDGSKNSYRITVHKDDLYNLINLANNLNYDYYINWKKKSTANIGFKKRNKKAFITELKELGLFNNKHIPDNYLLAGNKQREALLQGLCDTDGFIDKRKSTVEFCNMNKNLAEGVLFLARSLGWRATIKEGRAKLKGRDYGTKYRVCFHITKEDKYTSFRLKRKLDLIKDKEGNKGRKISSIKSIELINSIPMQCIAVDSEDKLFLAGKDLIPTHNSTVSAEITSSMLVCLPELAEVYGKTYKVWNNEDQEYEYPLKRFGTNFKGSGTGGVRVGVYAPILDQSNVIFSAVKNILEGERGTAILREMGLSITISRGDTFLLTNNSRIMCKSASEGTNIESATHDLILLDEAQDITEKVIVKSIRPMIANTGGNMVYIGTCGTAIEDFYKTIQINKNLEEEDGVQRHFQFDYLFCSGCNPYYKKFVSKEINKYGLDSDWVRMNFRLNWLLERGQFCTEDMMFGKNEWVDKNILEPTFEIVESEKIARCYAGLDLGKENDSTVVTIIAIDDKYPIFKDEGVYYRKYILDWLEIHGDNYESQYWEICDFLKKFNVDKMCIDATSGGDPVADRYMTYLTSIIIEPIKFSESKNSEMYKLAMQEVQAGRLKVPYGEASRENKKVKKFIHQMLELNKEYKGQYLKIAHPKLRGAHDDYFSSLALALWATRDATMPEIETFSTDLFGRTGAMVSGRSPQNIILSEQQPYHKAREKYDYLPYPDEMPLITQGRIIK
ncbi:MAG: LAGLIDADG family homing endonuclease [Nanoarchaeota archaeon]